MTSQKIKKLEHVRFWVWLVFAVLIAAMIVLIVVRNFSVEEAEQALGETYDFSEGWTVSYADGTVEENVTLPLTIPAKEASSVIIANTLNEDYAGLAVGMQVGNAAVRAYLDEKQIYENGFSSQRIRGPELPDAPPEAVTPSKSSDGSVKDATPSESQGDTDKAATPGISREDPPEPPTQSDKPSKKPEGQKKSKTSKAAEDPEDIRLTEEEKKQQAISTQIDRVKDKIEYRSSSQENYLKTEAGDILIDLNTSISEDTVLVLYFEQAKPESPILIGTPSVAQRDVAVIGVLRASVFPLACCIVIIILSAILVTLDFTRVISRRRTRGLGWLAVLAIDMMLYSFIDTDIPVLFFNNDWFFMVMGEMCYVLVPLFLAWFFARGFRRHYPKRTEVLLWTATLYALSALTLEVTRITYFANISYITLGVQLFTIGMILWMLHDWKRDSQRYKVIWLDVVGYFFLTAAVLMDLLWEHFPETKGLETVLLSSTVLCSVFLTAQHIHIVLFEYREHANAAAKRLAEEMKRVEEKNAQLAVARTEAEEARLEAMQANEAKGSFLANMSHEIRTPINAVLGMDEMILRETKEKDIRGYAMDIFTAGHTLLSLINDILDFSKIESGKMEIVPVDYDLSSMINDLYNMISSRAKAKDLVFEVDVDGALPSRYYGDDVRIRQVLTNILTNAVKYTPEGHVWFRISGRREVDYEILHFEIEDTGIGIKEEDLPKLYEAYRRIEEGRNRHIEGTGLGMNITLQLLQLMDSRLEVESVYGEGSKFYFDLRQRITNDTPLGDFRERILQHVDNYQYTESFIAPDAKVLVVDDNSMNRKVFISLLKPTQIQITEAERGQEAVDLALEQHFDIIFMDHMMPGMDGVEAMQRIKSATDGPCADTPVFVLTANAVAGAKEEYLKAGFDGFISKPVVSERLEEAIRDTLPAGMLVPVEEEDVKQSDAKADNRFIEELPAVDGLDWYYAFMHLPDRDILEHSVQEFATLLPVHAKKLSEMYVRLPDEEAFADYRIQVHGMKSSAATVGIVPLAGMAKVLEFAVRDQDEDVIRRMHPVFMREWESYADKLHGVFGIGEEDDADKPEADMDKVHAMLEMLIAAMEDFDVDQADELVGKLLAYRYGAKLTEKMADLKAAVADLDEELVGQIVREIQAETIA